MEDTRLFPHVGMKVPLNYSMFERLAQEGSMLVVQGVCDESMDEEEVLENESSDRAEWETAVTEHVTERATPALRKVCSQSYASLHELLEARIPASLEIGSILCLIEPEGVELRAEADELSDGDPVALVLELAEDLLVNGAVERVGLGIARGVEEGLNRIPCLADECGRSAVDVANGLSGTPSVGLGG